MMDSLLGQRYEVRQEIGRGGYGQVCKGYDHERGRKVAIKLEKADELDSEVSYLKKEEEVYSKLKGEESFGIANIHQFGADLIHDDPDDGLDDNGYILHYMVMDLLGPDLEELLTECSEQFSLKTVLLLADQMIRIIQYVHSKDYIHGDIKPRNFVLGRGKKGSNMIYMVDFGLAQRYRDSQTKEHIAYSDTASYAGTTMFTSLNCHQCIQKSRRDDLESLGYVLVYFLCGSLPWQDIKDWNDKSEKRRLVYEKKASISIEELCTGLPCEFVKYMEYCRSLQFDQEPDYDYLRKLFHDLYDQAGFTDVLEYDWMLRPKKYYLKIHLNSSEVDAEDVFYFFNVVYKPIEEPELNLQTIEECLEHVFKFVTSKHQLNSENDFKWNNMSMNDIVEYHIKNDVDIAWIHKWDDLDWKTATDKEATKKRLVFARIGKRTARLGVVFMKCAYDVYNNRNAEENISCVNNKDFGVKSEGIKRFIDVVTHLTAPQYFMSNGSCVKNLPMFISKSEIADASQFLESRHVNVTVKPDGVFTTPRKVNPKFKMFDPNWEMVLEIYGPSKGEVLVKQEDESVLLKSPTSAYSPDNDSVNCPDPLTSAPTKSSATLPDSGIHSGMKTLIRDSGIHQSIITGCSSQSYSSELKKKTILVMDTPATKSPSLEAESISPSSTSDKGMFTLTRKPDIIADPAYRSCIREHIKISLPSCCRDYLHTMRKMAGQHVLQLLAQLKVRQESRGFKEGELDIEKSLGIFIINEFIYFSRLDMSSHAYNILIRDKATEALIFDEESTKCLKQNPPQVSFSNFCLDITKNNHRLAFVLFLRELLYPEMYTTNDYGSEEDYIKLESDFEMC